MLPGNIPDFPNWSWREYGQRIGVWRVFDAFTEAGARASCTMNAKMAIERRPVIDAALVNTVRADAAKDLPSAARVTPAVRAVPDPIRSAPLEAVSPSADTDAELRQRIAALESRVEEQDAALRRILTLLVDWVESDTPAPRGSLEAVRGAAA
jgi:hypothetical protein